MPNEAAETAHQWWELAQLFHIIAQELRKFYKVGQMVYTPPQAENSEYRLNLPILTRISMDWRGGQIENTKMGRYSSHFHTWSILKAGGQARDWSARRGPLWRARGTLG